MLALKTYRDKARGVPDLLDWAALVDDGIVLGKSGALLAGFYYRGPDTASSTADERNYVTERVNAALARLGSGWVSWFEAARLPSAGYPSAEASAFPDPVSRLIDAERRRQFTTHGAHYESDYALVVQYTPPLRRNTKIQDYLWDEDPTAAPQSPADQTLAAFRKALDDLEDALGTVLTVRRMTSYTHVCAQDREHLRDELVDYLHFCLTGDDTPLNIPPHGMYLDAVIGGRELWTGDTPRIGERYIACVSLEGFPGASYPNVLDVLEHLPVAYRWSSRFIHLDQHEAVTHLHRYRRKWKQKVRGFWSQVFRTQGGVINEDALLMAGEAEAAITDASSALVTFGYYTPVIVLMGEDRARLLDSARLVSREVQRLGFACRLETINAVEAWLGTLPGHPHPNVRRPLIHTLNLADLLPLASVWAGLDAAPCPFYPEASPPLLYGSAPGSTPFRLNLHVGDVGHTLVFGPTGAGKSTLLGTVAAQFRRYPGATVVAFDKGRSMLPLALACGGAHHDIAGEASRLSFAPLAALDTAGDRAWAEDWIESCYQLQTGMPPTPAQREEIHRAMRLLSQEKGPEERSLTDFLLTVQDEKLRSALTPYTISGPLGHLLDSTRDGLGEDAFTVFEIEELMGMGEKSLIPVLLYLFRRFEKSLHGQPALLLLDEAWVMLGHPVFREKIREWLKVLRKANCAVVLATQSLSDAVRSGLLDVLLESCPTKLLLPNEEADKGGTPQVPGPRDLYTAIGLNEVQIGILKTAAKKRDYYYLSPEGRRLFSLALGPVALAFVGVSDKESVVQVRELAASHGADWPFLWLQKKGVRYDHLL